MHCTENSGKTDAVCADDIIVCPDCDLIVAAQPLDIPVGSQLVCPRCRYNVRTPKKDSVQRTFAFGVTALLLFFPAHFMLLLHLDALGLFDQGTIFDSMKVLYHQGYFLVALIVLLTAILIPLVKLGLLCTVSLGISRQAFIRHLPTLFRWYCHLEEWGMTEVYLIGVFVTIIKMSGTTDISYEKGFFFFVGLTFAMIGCMISIDKHHYWDMIEFLQGKGKSKNPAVPAHIDFRQSALQAGLVQCTTCHKVMHSIQPEPGDNPRCVRCGGGVHGRTPHSVSMTWALILTAVIFSIPANVLPIMQIDFLGIPEKSTIMDGIEYFFRTGSFGIGVIIFTASILVPLFKVIGLIILLYSIHFNRWSRLTQKSIMFRFIKFIGRWSMLDIFVIALLCALVDLGFFTTITAAPAATFFSFVVISTMFAAISFDPRLLWDISLSQKAVVKE